MITQSSSHEESIDQYFEGFQYVLRGLYLEDHVCSSVKLQVAGNGEHHPFMEQGDDFPPAELATRKGLCEKQLFLLFVHLSKARFVLPTPIPSAETILERYTKL